MSRKKRKPKPKPKHQNSARPRQIISPQQNTRFQQAVQAHTAGKLEFAERSYRTLLAEKVRLPALFNNLAMICMQSGREDEALSLLKRALALDPGFIDARINLAAVYEQLHETDKAISLYEGLVSQNPGMIVARYLLANQLKAQGKLDEAMAHYQTIMEQQPDYTQAHFTYSGAHKYKDADDPHIAAMLELNQRQDIGPDGRIQLSFALAKAYEDLGDYPRAFDYLKTGNDLRYRKYNYSIEGDQALIENIMETFSREALQSLQVEGQASDRPIFIVGMPRSGTSLVEKILASHSDVFGAGELEYMYSLAVQQFFSQSGSFLFKPLDFYSKDKYETLGKAYLDLINRLNSKAPRITDKLPFNFMMVGLIRIALPNAKIIHCVRDPRDICLSVYRQNFATENYRFAYDLTTIGQFCNLYRRLMEHWHQVLPGVIYDIEYESLTHNPEEEIRKLLAACDLEWQDSCLDFHKSKGLVKSASFYQVRQPMYTSSVALWQRYQEFLGPLFEELERGEISR